MPTERLSAVDAAFLHVETSHEPQHVGSLSILEGGPLRDAEGRIRIEEMRAAVLDRLHKIPRLRQRVRMAPLRSGRPVWVDDEHFDIEYHVRLTALPRPGGRDQLLELMGRLQSLPLDRSRPLWEVWVVDGLADGSVAQVLKAHHALGDGMANVDMALALVDLERNPPPGPPVPAWEPDPEPSDAELLRSAVVEGLRRPGTVLRTVAHAVRHPRWFLGEVGDVASAAALATRRPAAAPWNVAVSAHRRWAGATISMDEVRQVREATGIGATLNDVVLAVCTGALRDYLVGAGEAAGLEHPLQAMVPVSQRPEDAHHDAGGQPSLGNLISLIVVDLPVGEPDPLARLARIRESTRELKGSGVAHGVETVVGIAGSIPLVAPELARVVSRGIPMNLAITNVPGPPMPLYELGAKVTEAYPYVEVIDGEGLTIAVLSYEGRLHFGLTADLDVMADLGKLAGAIESNMADLLTAAG